MRASAALIGGSCCRPFCRRSSESDRSFAGRLTRLDSKRAECLFLNRLSADSRSFESKKRREENKKYAMSRAVRFLMKQFFKAQCDSRSDSLGEDDSKVLGSADSSFSGKGPSPPDRRLPSVVDQKPPKREFSNAKFGGSALESAIAKALAQRILHALFRRNFEIQKNSIGRF